MPEGLERASAEELRRPRFKRQYQVRTIDPDLVILSSDTGETQLRHRLLFLLAPLLDGTRTVDDIATALADRLTVLDVFYGVWRLQEDGYLVEADDRTTAGLAAFRDFLDVPPDDFAHRLATVGVSVRSVGSLAADGLRASLESLGVRIADAGELAIVLADDYLHDDLDEVNREALRLGRPWLLVKPAGASPWIGPLLQPYRSACWACLAHRLRERDMSRMPDESPAAAGRRHGPAGTSVSGITDLALSLAAIEAFKWIVRPAASAIDGRIVTVDVVSLDVVKHTVVRRPDCPACGVGGFAMRTPAIALRNRPIVACDGGYRSLPPDAVFQAHRHHVSPLTGIVSGLEQRAMPGHGVACVYEATHNFIVPPRGPDRVLRKFRKSAGKGVTASQARTSALCEALERYCGIFRGDEVAMRAAYLDISDVAVHPAVCLLFSERQYADRERWNQQEAGYNWVPQRFDERQPVDWTAAWSLTTGTTRYVPASYCFYGYPMPEHEAFCRPDSNGNAAGSNLEEAILQGFLEIVERDAVAAWWYNRARRPHVRLDAFDEPYIAKLADTYRRVGREIALLDLTSDIGIPVFAAVSAGTSVDCRDLMLGFGAHLDPRIAAVRALTEMNQLLPAVLAGTYRAPFGPGSLDPAFLAVDTEPGEPADRVCPPCADLAGAVGICVDLARARGLEVLAVDQTRADVGLSVVKIIVPGARPFWARFAPGRLYDTPVALGWIAAATAEDDLNPAHLLV